jgi:hypothetical protein
MNRRWHAENGGKNQPNDQVGPLELEAIAAVHELNQCVNSIRVSEMLPRTSDLIFLNVKTHEGQAFCLELTMKGWRIASCRNDSMQGSHLNVSLIL